VLAAADVIIDVSTAEALQENLQSASKLSKPIVIATTGHSPEAHMAITAASEKIPILFSPNFSLGMLACMQAVQKISQTLKGHCAIDIIEIHHDQKKDAPSGSALALAAATGLKKITLDGRPEIPRNKESVSIHSIRAGNIPGEHTVTFICDEEKIELKHQAFSGTAFARGALEAAKFLVSKPAGLYHFRDVFNHE
jgi:4-hydroxy-tetrahydrodipicolinate reductase